MYSPPLQLVPVEPRRNGAGVYLGYQDDTRFHPAWWSGLVVGSRHTQWYSGLAEGEELVRLRLDTEASISADYGTPSDHRNMVEIVRIEVLESHWVRGYGRSAVREVAALHPNRRLGALSLNARSDLFWGAIGWTRYEPEDGHHSRSPLYLSH